MDKTDQDIASPRAGRTRACGTCSECCTSLAVAELGKAEGQRCLHQLDEGGCGIYVDESRPEQCSAWRCGWIVDSEAEIQAMPDRWRPNRSGVILDPVQSELSPDGWLMRIHLLKQAMKPEGGIRRVPSVILNLFFKESVCALMVPGQDIKFAGPEDKLALFMHKAGVRAGQQPL